MIVRWTGLLPVMPASGAVAQSGGVPDRREARYGSTARGRYGRGASR